MGTRSSGWRQIAILALMVLSVALAGCAVLNTGGSGSGPPDAGTVEQQYANLTGVSGVVNSTITFENGTVETSRLHQRYNPQTGYIRSRVTDTTAPDVGDVFAFNGTFVWEYDASRNEVTRLTYDGRQDGVPSNWVMTAPEVFRFLQDESTVTVPNDERKEINPLPAVPVTQQPETDWTAENETYTVRYRGTGTVDGRRTHVVELRSAGRWVTNRTIHYDADWFYPVKSVVDVDGPTATYTIESRYEDIEFNPDLRLQDFAFEPPANATLRTSSQGPKASDTYEELAERAIMPVPKPEFPDEFTFQQGYEQFDDFTGVQVVTYANDEGETFTIATFDSGNVVSRITDEYDTEQRQVCGATVSYVDHGTELQAVWQANATEYGPSSPPTQYHIWGNIDTETMITVVRSIQC